MLGRMTLRYRRSSGTCGARGAAISAPVRYRIGSSGATACRGRDGEPECRATPRAAAARPLRAGLAGAQTAGAVVGAVRWQVRSPVAFACRLRNDVENTVPGGAVLK